MLFIMASRAHSCGYVAIMVYYCYVVHQSEICNVCLVCNNAHWLEVRPRPLKVCMYPMLFEAGWLPGGDFLITCIWGICARGN